MTKPQNRLILAAGMRRSGSTWLYNVARLLLLRHTPDPSDVSAGWIDDLCDKERKLINLWKLHPYDQEVVNQAQTVLYCYRDIRDVIASLQRKFGIKPTIDVATELLTEFDRWVACADVVLKFEHMLTHQEESIVAVAHALGIRDADKHWVEAAGSNLEFDSDGAKNERYNMENLYHRDHFTHGGTKTWSGQIPDEIIGSIEREHETWFVQHGYELYFSD